MDLSVHDSYTYEYLPWRGITKETMQFYGVKTKIDMEGKPVSLSFNYPNTASKTRLIDTKSFFSTGDIAKAGLFGRNLFDPLAHKCVTITEGELDALSVYQMLGCPAVSVSSSSSGLRDCTRDYSWLRDFEQVYLCLDSDAPGRACATDIAKLFEYGRVFDCKPGVLKDANAYLQAGKEIDFKNIWYSSKKFLPETIRSSLSDFHSILEAETEQGIPYGPFLQLTEMTYGIRTAELILVTAPEGVGKTEFLHALEYDILKHRDWNVAGIFLEETPKRHLQALAGIHLGRPTHLPDSGCSVGEVQDAVKQILGKDDRLFLDVQFGSTDVQSLLGNIRFLVAGCQCRVVMLDHISVAVGALEGEDQRRALDLFFTHAETMVKELDFSLIVVSHVNDYGQTRGSRWGGKMADIRIDLSRDTDNGSNILDIQVSKNRFAGRTGPAGSYAFNPISRIYTPVTGSHGANDNEPEQSERNLQRAA
jgi:twinkle protein